MTSVVPTLQQHHPERSEPNYKVGNSELERNQSEVLKKLKEVQKNAEHESEISKQKTPEPIPNSHSGNADLSQVKSLGESVEVCIQTDLNSKDSISTVYVSDAIDNNSKTANSGDLEISLDATRKSNVPLNLNDKSVLKSSVLNESDKCLNDNLAESSVHTLDEDHNEDRVDPKKHSELCNSTQHENGKEARAYLTLFSFQDDPDQSHELENKTVNISSDYNSDLNSTIKDVTSATPTEHSGENAKCSVDESSSQCEGTIFESEEVSEHSSRKDSLLPKSVESTLQQNTSEENKDIDKFSKVREIEATVSELEGVASKVVELTQYLSFDGKRNVTGEAQKSSTSPKKIKAEQKLHDNESFPSSNASIEHYDENRIEATSHIDKEICSNRMNSLESDFGACNDDFTSDVEERESSTKKISLNQITVPEIRKSPDTGESDQDNVQSFEDILEKTGLQTELHVNGKNANHPIKDSNDTFKQSHEMCSEKDFTQCKVSQAVESEKTEELRTDVNTEKKNDCNVITADAELSDRKEPQIYVQEKSLYIQSDTTGKENISEMQASIRINETQSCDLDSPSLLSSSGEMSKTAELNEHNKNDSLLKLPGSGSTNNQSNRRNSNVDASRNEFLQSILESGTSSVGFDLNVEKLNASENDSLKEVLLDSQVEDEKVFTEAQTSEILISHSNMSVQSDSVVALSEETLSQFREHESIETNESMLASAVECNEMESNEENKISNQIALPQSNMACNETFKDLDEEKENCWPQPVKDPIVCDIKLSCSFDSLDRKAELNETYSKNYTDNSADCAHYVEDETSLCFENKENSLKNSDKEVIGTPLKLSENRSASDDSIEQKRKSIEWLGTFSETLNENAHSSDQKSTMEQNEMQNFELSTSPLKVVLNDSALVVEEEAVVEKVDIQSVELENEPLKVLSKDDLVSEDKIIASEDEIQSVEQAGTLLRVLVSEERVVEKEDKTMEEKEIQSDDILNTHLKALNENTPVLEEDSAAEKVDRHSLELTDTHLKVICKDSLVSEEETLAGEDEIHGIKHVEAHSEVLEKNALASEKCSVEKDKEKFEHADKHLNISSKDTVSEKFFTMVQKESQSFEHVEKHSKVLGKNVHVSEEESVVEKKDNKSVELVDKHLKISINDTVSEENSIVAPEDIESVEFASTDFKVLDENVIASEEKSVVTKEGIQSVRIAKKHINVLSEDVLASEKSRDQHEIQSGKHAGTNLKQIRENALTSEDACAVEKNVQSIDLVDKPLKIRSEGVPASEESVEEQNEIQSDEHNFKEEYLALENLSSSNESKVDKSTTQTEITIVSKDSESLTISKLENEGLEERGKNKLISNQDFDLPEANLEKPLESKTSKKPIRDENTEVEESENCVYTYDEIDAAPTRHRTFLETAIISNVSKEENAGIENNEAASHDKKVAKIKNLRNSGESLISKRNDRCKSEEPVASSSKTTPKPIQGRRSSDSLM
ncbi:uncharacterized protein LOC129218989 [Uloborus diversus]|uniref:uncharacterized protein LOC129218989 n=1 Tax=Uloborus diversus TaxID=327109 RepID=UPI00240941B8|nr:uncharacterized protein LOC129218989 [Uloborus diversus]